MRWERQTGVRQLLAKECPTLPATICTKQGFGRLPYRLQQVQSLADTLILDFYLSELWDNKMSAVFKPPCFWIFVIASLARKLCSLRSPQLAELADLSAICYTAFRKLLAFLNLHQRFSASALLYVGSSPMCCTIPGSIPGLYTLDASSTPSPVLITMNVPRHYHMFPGRQDCPQLRIIGLHNMINILVKMFHWALLGSEFDKYVSSL